MGKETKMELLEQLIVETRRIYKRLPKVSAYKELEPYKNKDDYYISFTSVEKIGINPQSQFSTPLGIYAYPLKEAWNRYDIDTDKEVGKAVPFAGDRPHVWLLKLKDGIKFVKSAEDYSFDDLNRDTKILIKHVLENKEKYYKSFNVMTPEGLTEGKVIDKFSFWARTAKIKSEISKLWNITRNIALKGREDRKWSESTSIITNWNTLLYRVLGYYGFADKTGTGYIHDNEPLQAVFLSKAAFEVVSLTPNKELSNSSSNWFAKAVKNKTIKVKGTKVRIGSGKDNFFWDKGDWFNGIWKNGIWWNGTWWNGTWENGTWYDGTWWNGTWENGTWVSGTWHDGTWKTGWIYDIFKNGNYKPDWEWRGDGCVKSPISPAEYWKGKRRD